MWPLSNTQQSLKIWTVSVDEVIWGQQREKVLVCVKTQDVSVSQFSFTLCEIQNTTNRLHSLYGT